MTSKIVALLFTIPVKMTAKHVPTIVMFAVMSQVYALSVSRHSPWAVIRLVHATLTLKLSGTTQPPISALR